jgi:hypothetical protein
VQVDEIVRDASQLRAFIKDTEDVININLDRYIAPFKLHPTPPHRTHPLAPPASRGLSTRLISLLGGRRCLGG